MLIEEKIPPLQNALDSAGLLIKRADLSPGLPNGPTVDSVALAVERTWETASRDHWKLMAEGDLPWIVHVTGKKDPLPAGVAKGLERMREQPPRLIVVNTAHLTRHLLYNRTYAQSGAKNLKMEIVYPIAKVPTKIEAPFPLTPHSKLALKWWLLEGRFRNNQGGVFWNP